MRPLESANSGRLPRCHTNKFRDRSPRLAYRDQDGAVNFDSYGTLQEPDTDHQAGGILDLDHRSFHTFEWSVMNPYFFAHLEEGPGRHGVTGCHQAFERRNFFFGDGYGIFTIANDGNNTGKPQHRDSLFQGKAAEQVTRKKRQLQFLDAVLQCEQARVREESS